MDPLVIGLVAASGLLHVAWNVRLKTAGDPLRAATIGLLVGTVIIVPVGLAAWLVAGGGMPPADGVVLGVVSGAVEAGYFVLLAAAYRRGDLSLVYPLARGTAPLLLVVVGIAVLGERLGPPGWAGVICLLAGFLALQQPWRVLLARTAGRRTDGAIAFALATGVAIALYSSIDRVGTRIIPPIPYAAILWLTGSLLLVAWVALVEGGRLGAGGPESIRAAAVSGVFTLGAYLLILVALSVSPLTAVAPLRESATVVAAAWGAVRMGEASDRADAGRRIVASVVIVSGALLLALDA